MVLLLLGNLVQLLSIFSFPAEGTFLFPDWTASITGTKVLCTGTLKAPGSSCSRDPIALTPKETRFRHSSQNIPAAGTQ